MRIVDVERCGRRHIGAGAKNNYWGYRTTFGCLIAYGEHWWEVQVFPHHGAVMDGDFMHEGLREEFQAWIQLLR